MVRYTDCRTLSVTELKDFWYRFTEKADGGQGLAITAWQASAISDLLRTFPSRQLLVTVPDFLHYGRLVNTGQAKTIARLPVNLLRSGLAGTRAGLTLASQPVKAAQQNFWHFAKVLLKYDLALLPSGYTGAVLLHSHLMDFACVFGRRDFLDSFFSAVGKTRQTGIHTQQIPSALTSLAQWNLRPEVFSYLAAPGDASGEAALEFASNKLLHDVRLIAEIESWPADLQGPLGLARFTSFRAEALLTALPSLDSYPDI